MQTVVNITQHLRNYECKKGCTGSSGEQETNILAVLRFDKAFERDAFRFNSVQYSPRNDFQAGQNAITLLSSRIGASLCNVMTRLLFNLTSEKHILFATRSLYYLVLKMRFFYENNQKRITVSIKILASHKLRMPKPPTNRKKNISYLCSLLMQNFPLKIAAVNTFWI